MEKKILLDLFHQMQQTSWDLTFRFCLPTFQVLCADAMSMSHYFKALSCPVTAASEYKLLSMGMCFH